MSEKIKQLIIHCSASGWGDAKVIDEWHRQRGWKMIGYHYVITNGRLVSGSEYDSKNDGLIQGGRPLDNNDYMDLDERGAHAYGLNKASIGVCLIGDNKFTRLQFKGLITVCKYWQIMVPGIEIMGHYQVSDTKTCPNFKVDGIIDALKLEHHELNNMLHSVYHNQLIH